MKKKIILILLLCVGLVKSYTPPSNSNVELVLGEDYTSPSNYNVELVLGEAADSAPDITAPTFSPATAYTTNNVYCNATPTDAENTTLTVEYFWYNCTSSCVEFSSGNNTGLTNNSNAQIASISSSDTTKGDTWNCSVRSFDGSQYSSWKSGEITIQNTAPTINLLKPDNGNTSVRTRTPDFSWNGNDDDSDSLTYNIWVDDNSDFSSPLIDFETQDENYTPTSNLQLDTTYFWRVQAYDSHIFINSSDWNFTTESYAEITLKNSSVNFGSMGPHDTKNTTSDTPYPLVVRNDGNVEVDLTFRASDGLWTSALAPLDTAYLQFKADDRTEAGSYSSAETSWTNISGSGKSLASSLNYTDTKDEVVVDLLILVPEDEPSGSKSATFVVETT